MKKTLLLSLIVLLTAGSIAAQLGLRIYNYRPTGDFGAYFKPTISAEFGYVKPFDKDRWVRPVAMLTVLNMRPRMAEFPASGEVEDASGLTVYAGTQSFQRYIMLQGHVGIDIDVFKKEKFNAFIGSSIILGSAFIHYHSLIDHVIDEEGYVSGKQVGIQMRLGAEYQLTEQIGLQISVNRSYYRMFGESVGGNFWSNNYGAGLVYEF